MLLADCPNWHVIADYLEDHPIISKEKNDYIRRLKSRRRRTVRLVLDLLIKYGTPKERKHYSKLFRKWRKSLNGKGSV